MTSNNFVETREIKKVYEMWEKNPSISIDAPAGNISVFSNSQNINYQQKVEPIKDSHFIGAFCNDKTYFKSISGIL